MRFYKNTAVVHKGGEFVKLVSDKLIGTPTVISNRTVRRENITGPSFITQILRVKVSENKIDIMIQNNRRNGFVIKAPTLDLKYDPAANSNRRDRRSVGFFEPPE